MPGIQRTVERGDVTLAVTDLGGDGSPVLLLHGLAGSSREMMPTALSIAGSHRVVLIDQRGHGRSTRQPSDLSRDAFVADVVAVLEDVLPGEKVALVGQSMGAHTALLVAVTRPDLISRLIMLEGHVAGSDRPDAADEIGRFFASWPSPFADPTAARAFLGTSPLARAWVDDLERTPTGLIPRFDASVMRRTIRAVHAPRWTEWEKLAVPTLAIFAENGIFTAEQKSDLIRRRPATRRTDIASAGHDAHLEAFETWIELLRAELA